MTPLETLRERESEILNFIIYAQDHNLPEAEKFNENLLESVRVEIEMELNKTRRTAEFI